MSTASIDRMVCLRVPCLTKGGLYLERGSGMGKQIGRSAAGRGGREIDKGPNQADSGSRGASPGTRKSSLIAAASAATIGRDPESTASQVAGSCAFGIR